MSSASRCNEQPIAIGLEERGERVEPGIARQSSEAAEASRDGTLEDV
jgi:hypothetical protein